MHFHNSHYFPNHSARKTPTITELHPHYTEILQFTQPAYRVSFIRIIPTHHSIYIIIRFVHLLSPTVTNPPYLPPSAPQFYSTVSHSAPICHFGNSHLITLYGYEIQDPPPSPPHLHSLASLLLLCQLVMSYSVPTPLSVIYLVTSPSSLPHHGRHPNNARHSTCIKPDRH